jgi:hypothetical protein
MAGRGGRYSALTLRVLRKPQREFIPLRDLTDCLLDAYEAVTRRAQEMYLQRGDASNGELDDWLSAERELLPALPIDIAESGDSVYALASVPNSAAAISIGIESRWLLILAQRHPPDGGPPVGAQSASKSGRTPDQEGLPGRRLVEPGRRDPWRDAAHSARPPAESRSAGILPAVLVFDGAAEIRRQDAGATKLDLTPSATHPPPARTASVLELPAEVDAARSIAVLSNGLLAIRMPKSPRG